MVTALLVSGTISPLACWAFTPLAARTQSVSTTTPNQLWAMRNDPNEWLNQQQPHLSSLMDVESWDDQDSSMPVQQQQQHHQEQQHRPRKSMNPTPALVSAWQKSGLGKAPKPSALVLGVALMLATTFAMSSNPAWAAMSGGRAGGGGYGRATMSRPAPRSYSGGGGYGSYSYGTYGRPRTNVYINPAPTIVSPFAPPIITPFAPVVPFSPFGAGVAVARGPSIFDIMFFGAVALVIANTIRGIGQSATDRVLSQWSDSDLATAATPLGPGTTVAQISVALQVPNRDDPQSILKVLPRLASAANTERRAGLQNLTSQVALELLRRKSQIVSATTKTQHFRDSTKATQSFGQRAIQERSKFEKESFSRYRGTDYGSSSFPGSDVVSGKATMAVVTLLVEIDGDSTSKLPNISSLSNVEEALRKIAADSRVGECLQSAEILWTPGDRSETLTERDVVADYPELRSV